MFDRETGVHELRRRLADATSARVLAMLAEHRPEEIASLLGEVEDAEVERVFEILNASDPDLAAEVLSLLGRHDVARVLSKQADDQVADLLEHLPPDDATWIVEQLPDDRQAPVVEAMEGPEAVEVREHLDYPEDSAGRLMSEEYVALSEAATAGEAIHALQNAGEEVTFVYVYLVDAAERLAGVVSLRRLLRVKPDRVLRDLSPSEIIRASVYDDQEQVAGVFAQNDLVSLPVVDGAGKLVGVVTHDDVLDVVREEATEDMLAMAGTTPDEIIAESAWGAARIRMPWLLFSMFGGLVAMKILDIQEKRLGELFIALALFVPVIVGMGGNLGTQAATIVVRGLATGRVHRHDMVPVFWRELRTAAIVGVTYGVLLMVAGWALLDQSLLFCAVVGVSLIASMVFAAAIGTLLPMGFETVGVDPAVATGPLVTTSMDVLGILVYLSLASWLLG